MRLVLASRSAARRAMLDAAGVAYDVEPADLDEAAVTAALIAAGAPPRDIADRLSEMKAVKVSARAGDALVLGSDSVVALADGTLLDKPATRDDAARQLAALSGTRHDLFSAAVIAQHGRPVWRQVDRARLSVRPLSSTFIEAYLDAEWPAIAGCVGGYRIEGRGVQLFAAIEGSHFTILGLPLIGLLDYMRVRGVVAA